MSKIRYIHRALRYRYVKDRAELAYLAKNVNRGDLVLDIGAHKGSYLFWLRQAVGKTGNVIAFEPQPILYNYLHSIIDSFGFQNVALHNAGVSSENGNLKLYIPKDQGLTSPSATFEPRALGTQGHFVEVPVLQLDAFLAKREQKVSFIKLDVEGHEMAVFKGAMSLISSDRPQILFECENKHLNGLQVQDIFDFLRDQQYQGFFFFHGQLLSIKEFKIEKHQRVDANGEKIDKKNYVNNFIFKPKS